MPTGESVAPGGGPAHDVFRRGFFPKGEVKGIAFFVLSVQLPGIGKQLFHFPSGEFAVLVFFVVGFYVKIDAAVAFIGKSVLQNLFYEFLLLYDVTGGVRLDAWAQGVELLHVFMETVGIELDDFHRFQAVQLCLFFDFIFPVVAVVGQMPYVCDVADVSDFIPQVLQVSEKHVERDGRAGMSQMGITVNGRPANV